MRRIYIYIKGKIKIYLDISTAAHLVKILRVVHKLMQL